jgi:hypothetical protein
METVRVEHCLKCGHTEMKNLFHIKPHEDIKVYVQCANCKSYVCRYTLRRYTSEETFESLVKLLAKKEHHIVSGREQKSRLEYHTTQVEKEYKKVLEMAEHEDQRRVEQIIDEELTDEDAFPESD